MLYIDISSRKIVLKKIQSIEIALTYLNIHSHARNKSINIFID